MSRLWAHQVRGPCQASASSWWQSRGERVGCACPTTPETPDPPRFAQLCVRWAGISLETTEEEPHPSLVVDEER